MTPKHVAPTIDAKSFSCPHCGALAAQDWMRVHAEYTDKRSPPGIWTESSIKSLNDDIEKEKNAEKKKMLINVLEIVKRTRLGRYYISDNKNGNTCHMQVSNMHISRCFSCDDICVWRYDTIVYPPHRHEIEPNPDLLDDIRSDFDEARQILSASPKASAALLRLCVQKLCKQLGQPGENLNSDIGALVRNGLPQSIQQALDIVRVIGNNAVHPGTINLNDDRKTAMALFDLVNIIADDRISKPKAIAKLFDEKLPEGAKIAIARRDGSEPKAESETKK